MPFSLPSVPSPLLRLRGGLLVCVQVLPLHLVPANGTRCVWLKISPDEGAPLRTLRPPSAYRIDRAPQSRLHLGFLSHVQPLLLSQPLSDLADVLAWSLTRPGLSQTRVHTVHRSRTGGPGADREFTSSRTHSRRPGSESKVRAEGFTLQVLLTVHLLVWFGNHSTC